MANCLRKAPEPGGLWPGWTDCASPNAGTYDRVVVAVDPPVTGGKRADACGIIVAGATLCGDPGDWRATVLEDASVEGASPVQWARAAIAAMERHGADRLVAEVNQGGDLVATVIRQTDPQVPYRGGHASRGRAARAEPVAGPDEQGRGRCGRTAEGRRCLRGAPARARGAALLPARRGRGCRSGRRR